jgi:membrane-bound ClpP family serine protease
MSPDAKLGEIVPPDSPALDDKRADLYLDLVKQRREDQVDVIRKMFDPSIEIVEGRNNNGGGVVFIDLAKKKSLEGTVAVTNTKPVVPRGRVALYSAELARKLGICKAIAKSRSELAENYGLSPASLRDDPRGDRPTKAFRLVIRGEITQGKREAVVRSLKDVVRDNGTIVFLQIDCGGGEIQAATDLAADLRAFEESPEDGILIVAFIPDKAPDTGTIVALGCSEIVMSKRKNVAGGLEDEPESEIGDFESFVSRAPGANSALEQSLVALASAQKYPPILVEGMVNYDLELVRVHKKTDATIHRTMSAADYEAEKADWVQESVIKPKGVLLKLNATKAAELGLARYTVDSKDINTVYDLYGVDPAKVKEATPGWLDRFAAFLQLPTVTVLLVVIGFTGLILELKVPGTTIPGIIAALCFILMFWAHTRFSGQVAILAGLIFLLGIILILMEVFVIPGFGATGVLGILFMLAGLGLVTFEKIPQTGAEWGEFGLKVFQYLIGLMVSSALSLLLAKFLPRIPYANRMVLTPPTESPEADHPASFVPGAAQASELLGAIGTAVTVLRPAGSVRFGDQYVDVVTDGMYVQSGARVRVIEVEGNRIVVKEV